MRIAFVSTILHLRWGGADTLWTRAAEAAAARGDTVLLAISSATALHPRIRRLIADGVAVLLRRDPKPPGRLGRVLRRFGLLEGERRLNATIADFRPDLVVFSQGGTYDLLMYPRLVAQLQAAGTPFRVIANWQQEHPSLPERDLNLIRSVLETAERIFFVSTRNLEVTRRHLRSPLQRAGVVHNPLRWQPADNAPWPNCRPAMLATVSRLEESKGIQILLHALSELGSTLPEWRLSIHGEGSYEKSLRELIAHLGLGDRVRLVGHIDGLRGIWANHHLLCSPALDDGVPMTIPEAMLCERPVLATCVGGAEDWLHDGDTGFLCPAGTVPLMAATLQRAFAARERWPFMGHAASDAARTLYRPDDYLALIA